MIIIGISDIHGDVESIRIGGGVLSVADVVLIGGDITNFGGKACVEAVVDAIGEFNKNIFAVGGNCDNGDVSRYLDSQNINLDGKIIKFKGIEFCGVAGAMPYSVSAGIDCDDGFSDSLEDIKGKLNKKLRTIFVSHQPAYGTSVDLSGSGHGGAGSIRKFIEETQPMLALSGHMHQAVGTDKIGNTILANPGPLRFGGYVYCELSKSKVELCEIRNLFA